MAHMNRPGSFDPRLALALVGLFAAGCGDGTFFPPGATLAIGTWGGDEAGVIVTEAGAHVHVGCTFGDIPGKVPLDLEGRFTVDGTYVLRAFPVVIGPTLPAQFSGRVVNRTLTLAIAVNDTVEDRVVALGPVTVVFGDEPRLGPCPICRLPASASAYRGEDR